MQTLENGRVVFLKNESLPAFDPDSGAPVRRLDGSLIAGARMQAPQAGPHLLVEDFLEVHQRCYLCDAALSTAKSVGNVRQIFWPTELVKCACGLVQKKRRATAQLLQRIYDEDYSNFNAPTLQFAMLTMAPRINRLGRPRGRLLDVGCGNGAFTMAASAAGWDAVGVDPFLPPATERAVPQTRRVDVLNETERATLGTFDVVTLWAVWEHLTKPVEMLTVAASLLRPGGRLVLNSPNGDSLHRRFLPDWYMATLVEHLHFLTPQAAETLAARLQLRLDKVRRCGVPFPLGRRGAGARGQGLNAKSLAYIGGVGPTAPPRVPQGISPTAKKGSLRNQLTRHPLVGSLGRKVIDTIPLGDHIEIYLSRK